jgi:SAM-dependent methyltransferase
MTEPLLFEFEGDTYPDYLRRGNAARFITPIAQQFCQGRGFDVGCNKWPLPGAMGVDDIHNDSFNAYRLPDVPPVDYVFSSHCLEHLADPVRALEHWLTVLKPGGTLFLYLPHPDQKYWRPERCRKHLHSWTPERMAEILRALGLLDVLTSQRDLAWSFAAVGFKPGRVETMDERRGRLWREGGHL